MKKLVNMPGKGIDCRCKTQELKSFGAKGQTAGKFGNYMFFIFICLIVLKVSEKNATHANLG